MRSYYTKDEIISMVNACEPNKLYNHKSVNFISTVMFSGEYVTEIIASLSVDKLNEINAIHRDNYKVVSHFRNGQINTDKTYTNRIEENDAKELIKNTNQYTIENTDNKILGRLIDYQIPLKAIRNDKAGKIDLISVDDENKIIYIIELKNNSSKETLLRCVLEIETYYRQLDHLAFKKSFELADDYTIKTAVLIYKGTQPYHEYCELSIRPKLRVLIQKTKTSIFVVSKNT